MHRLSAIYHHHYYCTTADLGWHLEAYQIFFPNFLIFFNFFGNYLSNSLRNGTGHPRGACTMHCRILGLVAGQPPVAGFYFPIFIPFARRLGGQKSGTF
jgi:hypothetical protein